VTSSGSFAAAIGRGRMPKRKKMMMPEMAAKSPKKAMMAAPEVKFGPAARGGRKKGRKGGGDLAMLKRGKMPL